MQSQDESSKKQLIWQTIEKYLQWNQVVKNVQVRTIHANGKSTLKVTSTTSARKLFFAKLSPIMQNKWIFYLKKICYFHFWWTQKLQTLWRHYRSCCISEVKSTFDLILRLNYPNLQGLVPRPLCLFLILAICRGWS